MKTDPRHDRDQDPRETGIGGFVRSLLSGIPWCESAHAEEQLDRAAPKSRVLEIHNANGKVKVVGEDRDDIHVHALKHARAENTAAAEELVHAIRLEARDTPDALELEVMVPRKWNRHGTADVRVHVPRDIAIRASTSNGKLCITGMRSALFAQSGNGSVRVDDIIGDIDITTANAKVVCGCTVGRLIARSSNGKIQVGHHCGPIDAVTSNGLIHAVLDELGREGVTLATSNGRIVLELPDHPDADVDLRVDNGVIRTDFELGGPSERRDSPGRVRGRLGRGGSPIKLRTSNGTISLRECGHPGHETGCGETAQD